MIRGSEFTPGRRIAHPLFSQLNQPTKMKTKPLFLLTASVLSLMLSPAQAREEIFNGTATYSTLGGGENSKTRGGVYFIVDLTNYQYVEIHYFTQAGKKVFTADDPAPLRTFYVNAPHNQTFKEIVNADTTQLKQTEITATLFELTGKTTIQQYGSQSFQTMPIPRTMTGFLKQVHLPFAGDIVIDGQAIVLSYNQLLTIQANDAGGSLGNGVAKVNAFLISKGYRSLDPM